MVYAVHFTNRYQGRPRNLTSIEGNVWRTGCWHLPACEADKLMDGWIYLHEKKAKTSFLGGKIIAVEEIQASEHAREVRVAFTFTLRPEARNVRWRGAAHCMAWTSGVIQGSHRHESEGLKATSLANSLYSKPEMLVTKA